MRELLTITEAAEIKGVSRQAVHAAIEAGKLLVTQARVTIEKIDRKHLDEWQPNPNMKRAGRPKRVNT